MGGAASLSCECSLLPTYLVLLIAASGNFECFLLGKLKPLNLDFANFSSISFLKSISSFSIFGLIYLALVRGPQAKAMIFPYEVLCSMVFGPLPFICYFY